MRIEEGQGHVGRESEEKIISLTRHCSPPSHSRSLSFTRCLSQTRTPPHQPTYGPRRFSCGSVSCRGPSLGQRSGVQNSDSLSGKQASMANNETAIKEWEQHRIVPLRRDTCWRHHSSSASVQRPNRRFDERSFQLELMHLWYKLWLSEAPGLSRSSLTLVK